MTRREALALAALVTTGSACRPGTVSSAPLTAKGRYDDAIAKLKETADPYARWCALGHAAKASLAYGQDAEARTYAEELRTVAPNRTKDWNYGNAIQDFNIVLGVLALKSGDAAAAKNHLLEAGRSPGSPQMNSFGPNMTLAKALIDSGEKDAVLEYFELCRKFWKMDNGRLNEWRDDVKAGRAPNFGANLVY